MQMPRRSLATARERRRASDRFYRFEDQATDILRNHAHHLDVHRRSVMLFYLVFGLIAGFVIGMIGARGALAAPSTVEPVPALAVSAPLAHGAIEGPMGGIACVDPFLDHSFAPPEATGCAPIPKPERYAALMWPEHADLFARGDLSPAGQAPAPLEAKPLMMSMLISILAMAGMLLLIFWSHLGSAYGSRRRAPIGWPPE